MQVRRWGAAAALAGAIALAAVSIGATPVAAATATASATLVDAAGHQVGWAKFHEDGRGRVHVNVHVEGLSVGAHGIHIHTVGSCAHTAMAFGGAGGHFNPTNAPHPRHAGDLGNLHAKRNGKAHLNAKSAGFTLRASLTSILDANGSALVIHAGEDDLATDPTGNSGGRVACGVITPG